jgi:ribosomal protein S18 acetylase RimI-like enzyme
METNRLIFRRAAPEDFEVLHAIMLDAARWLASRGIDQWSWVERPIGVRYLRERLENAEVYLAFINDEPVATVSVQWEDGEIWGERGVDELAGDVHGLAVKRSAGGRGMGKALIEFASGIVMMRGRRMLRLDCMAANVALRSYYKQLGFAEAGESHSDKAGFDSALFEQTIHG